MLMNGLLGRAAGIALAASVLVSCEAASNTASSSGQGAGSVGGQGGQGAGTGASGGIGLGGGGGGFCYDRCSHDLHAITDCHGTVLQECAGADACDVATVTCGNACLAAESAKRSVGCEYYATYMDALNPNACFAAFVANTWNTFAQLSVSYDGNVLPIGDFAYIPIGSGASLTYEPFVASNGLAPNKVAILFLAGQDGVPGEGNPVCPKPSAVPSGAMLFNATGKGESFLIESDVPVVIYQINPFGGGYAASAGASLLLPTSSWGTNYMAVNAYSTLPSMNVIAREDGTQVSMMPLANIVGGGGLPPGSAMGGYDFTLDAGQYVQITQQAPLTGSILASDKPIGFMAGDRCSNVPQGVNFCDHLEQMIPPISAIGHEYVGVAHRSRSGEPARWRLIGVVDDIQLNWSNDIGGPATLGAGEVAEFASTFPFVVRSQSKDHPFLVMAYMSGGSVNGMNGVGDPDGVLIMPPVQYLREYVFFTDPTYPETNLVVVRVPEDEQFQKVFLDCAGELGDWQTVGDFEYTRVDLSTGDYLPVGNCEPGAHRMWSDGLFGLWVWGWGSPQTTLFSSYVSYGYPGGMNVQHVNDVTLNPR